MKNNRTFRLLVARILAGCAALVLAMAPVRADEDDGAEIKVSGLGWWRDREMRVAFEQLRGGEKPVALDANAVEDAGFLLMSVLSDTGFLNPAVNVKLTDRSGEAQVYGLQAVLETGLPRGLEARKVHFMVKRGVRSFVDRVELHGLTVLPEETGRMFFQPASGLFNSKAARAYSPSHLRRSAERLRTALRQRGYVQARVQAEAVENNAATGAVFIRVKVTEGPRWVLSQLRFDGANPSDVGWAQPAGEWVGEPWTTSLQQNIAESLRRAYYRKGYADVAVSVRPEAAEAAAGERRVTAIAQIAPGSPVTIGQVRFEGNEHTSPTILRRRVRGRPGAPLNPVVLERARYRLSRLGVFDSVDLRYEPEDGPVRDAVYVLKEGPRYEASALLGYGSYEQLRGGVEFRQMNLFGRAHQSRAEFVQSMKSTSGEYTYMVPELFGETVDGTARLFGLQREERAFLRQEYGASFVVRKRIERLHGAEGTAGYTAQVLTNRDNELATRTADDERVTAVSIDFGLTRDRRDNPLRPTHGARWFGRVETASQVFGGQVDYQRFELGIAYHKPIGSGQFVHSSLTHGVITTFGTTDERLPVNKRFYPGGDSSIRGYQDGEAAPRGADGRFIGAKSYLLANLEWEQTLIGSWSLVVFTDALGTAVTLSDYPAGDWLYSVGAGIRYQTIVGPLRVEYGRNLNPRDLDPGGTLHFSLGFPF